MPDDQELVEYLRDHGRGRARFSGAINEGIDPYSCHPEYLLSCFPDVSEYGSNYYYANREGRNRQTDDRSGHWINRRQDPIHKDGQIVGYKRRFTFYLGPGKSNKTDWLMTEYTSDDTPKAICMIYKTGGNRRNEIGQASNSDATNQPLPGSEPCMGSSSHADVGDFLMSTAAFLEVDYDLPPEFNRRPSRQKKTSQTI
ncbi:NAC domain-containing protein 72-like [Cocos nucifera]|uniref:NAC domain-containing protein 72-like n=1 Tax=Cocos nucifera TaxID=13894 RepID=A0A8K0IGZ6_COCNU|nr:NAC domain-containing protein 72-like [Cocos nucifera]